MVAWAKRRSRACPKVWMGQHHSTIAMLTWLQMHSAPAPQEPHPSDATSLTKQNKTHAQPSYESTQNQERNATEKEQNIGALELWGRT